MSREVVSLFINIWIKATKKTKGQNLSSPGLDFCTICTPKGNGSSRRGLCGAECWAWQGLVGDGGEKELQVEAILCVHCNFEFSTQFTLCVVFTEQTPLTFFNFSTSTFFTKVDHQHQYLHRWVGRLLSGHVEGQGRKFPHTSIWSKYSSLQPFTESYSEVIDKFEELAVGYEEDGDWDTEKCPGAV